MVPANEAPPDVERLLSVIQGGFGIEAKHVLGSHRVEYAAAVGTAAQRIVGNGHAENAMLAPVCVGDKTVDKRDPRSYRNGGDVTRARKVAWILKLRLQHARPVSHSRRSGNS